MGNKITVLPEVIRNKIAAGEVVQRPESVVKELLENSIDAGANNIELIIKGAGKLLIQVVDNGEGMSEEDLFNSIKRYATSKVITYEDLERINTFGFRGEALASVAAVSKLEIKTRRIEDEIGSILKLDDEKGAIIEKGNFVKGTSVSVKNLFYNVPARRNFLKSNATELKYIIDTFKRIALSKPEVKFLMFNDDDLILSYKGNNLKERIKEVIAENIHEAVVEVDEVTDYLKIKGFIAKPAYLSKSKGEQYLFVNDRFVQSKMVNHAVFSAFENILEKGDYPFFVLFIKLDPSKTDVNVHPSKLEIKFYDEKSVYALVNNAIKRTLSGFDLIPEISFDNNQKMKLVHQTESFRNDFSDRPNNLRKSNIPTEELDILFNSVNKEIREKYQKETSENSILDQNSNVIYHEDTKFTSSFNPGFMVILHNKYILTPIKSGLMIIDAHIAHERILYEKALKSFNADLPFSQQLLFAEVLQLDPADFELLKELYNHLMKLGFDIKFFSKYTIAINGVPGDIKLGTEKKTLLDILEEYKKNQIEKELEQTDNIAKSFSCKAAIKAGDNLSENEMRVLVDQLFLTSMPYVCPHGRPIIIKIQISELDRRFGRT